MSGSFGEYRSNPNPKIRRRVRSRLYGNIVCALDRNRYKVAWDNGTTSDCYSNCLSKEASFASLPPDVQPPLAEDRPDLPPQGQEATDNQAEAIMDNERDLEEEEHLPDAGGGQTIHPTLDPRRRGLKQVRWTQSNLPKGLMTLKEGCLGSWLRKRRSQLTI